MTHTIEKAIRTRVVFKLNCFEYFQGKRCRFPWNISCDHDRRSEFADGAGKSEDDSGADSA